MRKRINQINYFLYDLNICLKKIFGKLKQHSHTMKLSQQQTATVWNLFCGCIHVCSAHK